MKRRHPSHPGRNVAWAGLILFSVDGPLTQVKFGQLEFGQFIDQKFGLVRVIEDRRFRRW